MDLTKVNLTNKDRLREAAILSSCWTSPASKGSYLVER